MNGKNIFGRNPKSFNVKTPTDAMMAIMGDNYNDVQLSSEARTLLGKAFLSFESFKPTEESELSQYVTNNDSTVTAISQQYEQAVGQPLNDDQLESLEESIVMAQNVDSYVESSRPSNRPEDSVVSAIGGDADVGVVDVELAKESFEVHGMMNTLSMTVSYNIRPEKQSKAVELFFPTISLDSTQNNYTIDVHLSTVFNSKEYEITGKGDAYRNQKHIIKALRDATILKSNFTDIVPVFRTGQNEDNFVDTTLLPPYQMTTDFDEVITTSLLRTGKEVKVLHLAQTDRMIALGMADDTDQISANPRLKTLGLKVGDDVVLFQNLQYHAQAGFTYAPTGDRESIQLSYNVTTHLLDENTVGQKSKALPPELQALKDKGLEVLLRFDITGRGNTDTGAFTINPAQVEVKAIRDAKTKQLLSLEDPANKALIDELNKTSIIGWELDGTRTNSNIREHGLLLDDRVQRIIYGVKLHSPIAIRRPIDDKDAVTDSQRIDSLIRTSFIRRTNAGVTALFDILNMLKSQPADLDNTEPFSHSVVGVGQYFAKTYVRDINLDIFKTCQSMQTHDRLMNVNAVMTNFVLAEMAQAWCGSELAAAYELTDIGGNGSVRPHVIAIADNYTSKFFFREGDARTLGDGFDFTIEECSDDRFVMSDEDPGVRKDGVLGTVFLSFGKPRNGSLSVPLWFGNTLDKREIPRIVSRSRGSKYQHETMVQPWFSHICHLPVLVRITVTNLKRAVQERIPYDVQVTP